MAIQRPTVSPYAAAYTPTGILPLPPAPVAAPVVAPAAPVAPVAAPPPRMAMPMLPVVDSPDNLEHMPDPVDRSAANNFGYIGGTGRGLLTGAGFLSGLPLGLFGTLNDTAAMNMGRTGYGKQFSPSFFDVLTHGFFDRSGMYNQAALNMDNQNIAGRRGFMGTSPFIDYTHQYGPGFNDVPAYNPWSGVDWSDPGSVAAAEAVDNIAQAQANAVAASYGNPMDVGYYDAFGDTGMGGGYTESAAGEMDDDTSAGMGYSESDEHEMADDY